MNKISWQIYLIRKDSYIAMIFPDYNRQACKLYNLSLVHLDLAKIELFLICSPGPLRLLTGVRGAKHPPCAGGKPGGTGAWSPMNIFSFSDSEVTSDAFLGQQFINM